MTLKWTCFSQIMISSMVRGSFSHPQRDKMCFLNVFLKFLFIFQPSWEREMNENQTRRWTSSSPGGPCRRRDRSPSRSRQIQSWLNSYSLSWRRRGEPLDRMRQKFWHFRRGGDLSGITMINLVLICDTGCAMWSERYLHFVGNMTPSLSIDSRQR